MFHLAADDTGSEVLAFNPEVTPAGHVPGAYVRKAIGWVLREMSK